MNTENQDSLTMDRRIPSHIRTLKTDRLKMVWMWLEGIPARTISREMGALRNILLMTMVAVILVDGQIRQMALDNIGQMVRQMVDRYLKGCHLVIFTSPFSPLLPFIVRLMENGGLYKHPETKMVVIGKRTDMECVLFHPSLRNTIHVIYLVLQYPIIRKTPMDLFYSNVTESTISVSGNVSVYRRCLYCSKGMAGIQYIDSWTHTNTNIYHNFFEDQFNNLHGHEFKIVTVSYFPYIDYVKHRNEPGSTVTLRDSLDARLINTFATKLNFTFIIREEPRRSWGLPNNGNFSGMMGQLQREEVDLCTEAAPTPERLQVVEYARGYPSDIMSLTSLKPSLLPQQLALVRPFSDEVWISLLVGVVIWAGTLWVLQKLYLWSTNAMRDLRFNSALLYGWGALLEQSTPEPSISVSGQMLVGWWLVFCLVITTGFRSSLIAHLTVQGTSAPLDTIEDMVKQDGWQWGSEERLYKGAVIEYFTKHTDPVVRQVEAGLELLDSETALKKIKEGGYSLIAFRNYISVIVASRHTDSRGRSPFYISNKGISVLANLGWGFRKGAPFFRRFNQLLNRMEDTGITEYWTKEVVARRIKKNRQNNPVEAMESLQSQLLDDKKEVVLGLNHLQGAFYLLFLGSIMAFLILLGETLAHIIYS